MLRNFVTILLFTYSSSVFAGKSECKSGAQKLVEDAGEELAQHQINDGTRSATSSSYRQAHSNVPGAADDIGRGVDANIAELNALIRNNKKRLKECEEKCNPEKTDATTEPAKSNEKQEITSLQKECKKQIEKMKKQEEQALAENQSAKPKAAATKDKSQNQNPGGDSKSGKSENQKQASSGMPPMAMPPPQNKSDDEKPKDPEKPADPVKPEETKVADAQPAPQTGSAGFQQASAKKEAAKAAACEGRVGQVAGCENYNVASVGTTPSSFGAASAGGGGGGGSAGGSGGSINAAQVAAALAGQNPTSATGKDGNSTHLKAASLNLGTDGGGGGGGGSSGPSLADLDFGLKNGLGASRGPASAVASAAAAEAKLFKMSVAPERFPVVKIVEGTYENRCKAGLMLHCGKNP